MNTQTLAAPGFSNPSLIDRLVDAGLMPDWLVRLGIRRLLRQRLRDEFAGGPDAVWKRQRRLWQRLDLGPVAEQVQLANDQHYEVPPGFFERVLGPRLKYSSGLWEAGTESLGQAERAMLELTCVRAELEDGQRILELGCGWGSLTLWMAEHYPQAQITAVSNSADQRAFILERAARQGFRNLDVITADMNDFAPTRTGFERVVSVEMFEHMRNHRELMRRIAGWLRPGGKLFVHLFSHREVTYLFEPRDASDWMSREFFSGGVMPADALLLRHQADLRLESHWRVGGEHYRKTAEAWLANLEEHRRELTRLFAGEYGPEQAPARLQRWRVFFMACAELWGFRGGSEWFVSQYRFVRR